MISRRSARPLGVILALVATFAPTWGQGAQRPQRTFVQGVYLDRSQSEASKASLLLAEGRIEAILPADAPVTPGARLVEGEGALCLPAFLDAFSRTGATVTPPVVDQDIPVDVRSDVRVDMREANRKGVKPAFRAVEALALDEETTAPWREAGFGAALVAPGGELFSGMSALVTTRAGAARDLVLSPEVFAHGTFGASGGGYPTTLMGYMAQIRQFLLDADRHETLVRRHAQGRPGPRPPYDAELDAGRRLLAREVPLVVEAETARDLERWFKLADAFGFKLGLTGGRDAWKVADELVRRRVPVVLTLDWGKEVEDPDAKKTDGKKKESKEQPAGEAEPVEAAAQQEDAEASVEASEEASDETEDKTEDGIVWTYEEPLGVRRDKRRDWEEGRDCALRLHEAGIAYAFGSGTDKPKTLLENVRKLVEAGLDAEVALAGLTTNAAELLGVGGQLGRVAPGYDATFALWTADPLTDKKAKVSWAFVDGFPTEFVIEKKQDGKADDSAGPDEGVDASGTWLLTVESEQGPTEVKLILAMDEDGTVTGKYQSKNPMDESDIEADCKGQVSGKQLTLEVTLSFGDFEISSTLTATIAKGDLVDGEASYDMPWSEDPVVRSFEGSLEPEYWDADDHDRHACEEDHPHVR